MTSAGARAAAENSEPISERKRRETARNRIPVSNMAMATGAISLLLPPAWARARHPVEAVATPAVVPAVVTCE